jgi:1-aminocyclopropane-1-carboxylate deaminase
MLFDTSAVKIQPIHDKLLIEKGIELFLLRLDQIHSIISGNKLFKLNYFLKKAIDSNTKNIITFGGAYSNHLVATAYACKISGIQSVGIVRGEKPSNLSHTLEHCLSYGMELEFISRESFNSDRKMLLATEILNSKGDGILIPDGGYHPLGAMGAAEINDIFNKSSPTHICTAVGTATTLGGLSISSSPTQKIIGIPVLKGLNDIKERLQFVTNHRSIDNVEIFNEYHFGGYAKKTSELIDFMNQLYRTNQIPTDFVYTGKMMFAIMDKIKKNYFQKGSKIMCIHTGGLQGNLSLPKGTLIFD